MTQTSVTLSLAEVLVRERCPPAWKRHNLYVIREDDLVFYVGQSSCAYDRVWEHVYGGFKGRSTVGRFLLVNWPQALRFTVELLHADAPRFAAAHHNLDAAEARLIAQYAPVFNVSLNPDPTPLPPRYEPPDAKVPHPRSPRRMIMAAEHAVQRQRNRALFE